MFYQSSQDHDSSGRRRQGPVAYKVRLNLGGAARGQEIGNETLVDRVTRVAGRRQLDH